MMVPWRRFISVPSVAGLAPAVAAMAAVALMTLVALAASANEVMAQQIIMPGRALEMARDGRIMIIDIRRPDEWQKTGIPTGAKRATIRFGRGTEAFLKRIAKLTKGDKTKPIALICAAGVRSKHASRLLHETGYTQVMDISEGMLGNAEGGGWLRRDLPVSHCKGCR
ncbi:MAG: rhodanese-like domain-containing protein [Proteobacteria bacterium]|nr:rhodanese-like domain-containing protein [Pseudomonadota bacterium]